MLTNELKKGDKIKLYNGWHGTIQDNKRGNIRLAEIEGIYTEIGSIYAWDIKYHVDVDDNYIPIVLTNKQTKDRNKVKSLGF